MTDPQHDIDDRNIVSHTGPATDEESDHLVHGGTERHPAPATHNAQQNTDTAVRDTLSDSESLGDDVPRHSDSHGTHSRPAPNQNQDSRYPQEQARGDSQSAVAQLGGQHTISTPSLGRTPEETTSSVRTSNAENDLWVLPATGGRRAAYIIDSGYYQGRYAAEGSSGLEGMDLIRPTVLAQLHGGHRPDVMLEAGYVSERAYVGAVSMRGLSHHMSKTAPRQDHYGLGVQDGWVISVIADGVSVGAMSHLAAERAVLSATSQVRAALRAANSTDADSVRGLDWIAIGNSCRDAVDSYARQVLSRFMSTSDGSIDINDAHSSTLAKKMSTTLDIALIAIEPDQNNAYPFVRVGISGDSSAYVLDPDRGWHSIALGKSTDASQINNAVIPLPMEQGTPTISTGALQAGQVFVHVTDGFGDLIQEGRRPVGRFLFEQWAGGPVDSVRLLQSASVLNANGDDDRTAVVVWVGL
ncbi:protein phosphatase 2C domain-containing protein [Rhodococcus sp. WS3]|uniref:protein phosphatase 2C domain-containing protein n=1 Tax=Rhodococcus sp. WS3 TaxID=2486271 RepID=UPI001651805E|nr:protein phosphatase 2C domain-containing protein [Rhodococcus sp. WS3]